MAHIQPFKGIRPVRDKAHLVASRAVNTYKARILNAKLEENPFTFMHVILPEFGDKASTKPNSPERFKLVKKKFESFVKEKILIQDQQETFYLYRQIKDKNSYTGIIAGASIEDYLSGVIKKHEQTLTKRVEVFKSYLDICGFNAEPVLLTYKNDKQVDKLIATYTKTRPEYEFSTSDKVTHYLWIINNKKEINLIQKRFSLMDSIYIADGHHRTSSSALLAETKRKKAKKNNPKALYNYCMAYFLAEDQIKIFDFNRVVKDLNGLNKNEFIAGISKKFEIEAKGTKIYHPNKLHNFSMYLEGEWYSLTAKKDSFNPKNPVEKLDAQLLSQNLLAPVLNIQDLRTDTRISFIGGLKGMEELKRQVDENKMKVAFGLYPVKINQLKEIADTNNIMPPKTTWIEPKLRSGLVIQQLD